MRAWRRATVDVLCGRCGSLIPVGAPLAVLQVTGVTREFLRCATCATEPVPADLPTVNPTMPRTPLTDVWTRLTPAGFTPLLPLREPGEEG